MKRTLSRWIALAPPIDRRLRLALRSWRARRSALPDWRALIGAEWGEWEAAREAARGGPKVLVATSVGAHTAGAILESALAIALALRGAEVHVLLCDGVLPACLDCTYKWYADGDEFAALGPQARLCPTCFAPAEEMFRALGLRVHRYGELVDAEARRAAAAAAADVPLARIADYERDGIPAGEHAVAGALRYFARANLEGEPAAEGVLRRFLHGALLAAAAARRLFERERFRAAVFHHGIYVPQGLIGAAARNAGVRVVNWNPAYRTGCFIFSHGDSYHHTLMSEPAASWEAMAWGRAQDEEIAAYLRSRWSGTKDWIWFHERPQMDVAAIEREIGIDLSRPTIGMLTNVAWDAQLHYPANAFRDMHEWILKSIRYFAGRPDLQLVIRIHPAEIHGGLPSRQLVADEIRRVYPALPRNVRVIPPESRASTYAVLERCNAAIIYGTKMGVELAATGTPVIVAGEAWVRGKGFTYDVSSQAEYESLLGRLPFAARLDDARLERARRYAYHFFFRRMIPVRAIVRSGDWRPYRVGAGGLAALRPGACPGLDVIMRGILEGSDFVYAAERDACTQQAGAG